MQKHGSRVLRGGEMLDDQETAAIRPSVSFSKAVYFLVRMFYSSHKYLLIHSLSLSCGLMESLDFI